MSNLRLRTGSSQAETEANAIIMAIQRLAKAAVASGGGLYSYRPSSALGGLTRGSSILVHPRNFLAIKRSQMYFISR